MLPSVPSRPPRAVPAQPDAAGPPWREDVASLLALVAIGLVVFAPAFAGAAPLVRDFPGFTLPSRAFWQAAWSSGHVPQWNPFVGLGLPVLAAPVHGALYPGHVPLLLGPVERVLPMLPCVSEALQDWLDWRRKKTGKGSSRTRRRPSGTKHDRRCS